MQVLTPQELKTTVERQEAVTIVDLQPHEAYIHRHIPGAVQLDDPSHFPQDSFLVVYGEYDELGRGAEVTEKLVALGFSQVYRLQGGMMGWMEAGYRVEGGQES